MENLPAFFSAFFSNAWYLTHGQTPLFTFLMVAITAGPYPSIRRSQRTGNPNCMDKTQPARNIDLFFFRFKARIHAPPAKKPNLQLLVLPPH